MQARVINCQRGMLAASLFIGPFKSIVAQVIEVSIDAGDVRVHKVHCAIDCGRYINPNIISQ